jgi:hypothetical protein
MSDAESTLIVRQSDEGYGGDDGFEAILVYPNSDTNQIFAAIHPGGQTSLVNADQTGEYVIAVEANGPWAIIVS